MYSYCTSISEVYKLIGVSTACVSQGKTFHTQRSHVVSLHSFRASKALVCSVCYLVIIWARVGFVIPIGVENEYSRVKRSCLVRQINCSPLYKLFS